MISSTERPGKTLERESLPADDRSSAAFDTDQVLEQLGRILANPIFHNSKRLSTLLRFLVEETVHGRYDTLKERTIGIEVFGRTADYDTSLDASVRVAVAEVRKRLVSYYREPGHETELRIELPTRSYTAEFKMPEEAAQEEGMHRELESRPRRNLRPIYLAACAIASLVVIAWGASRVLIPASAVDRFWSPVLKSSGPVSISIGFPPQSKSSAATPPSPAASTHAEMSFMEFLDSQPQFPMSDLKAATDICAFMARRDKDADIRYAQETQLADLRTGPVIFLGSFRNDWAVRLGNNLRFRFKASQTNSINWIEDTTSPGNTQWAMEKSVPYEQVGKDYALVTRAFDQTTGQWWIGIAGLSGIGTLAAEQALTDPAAMKAIASRLPSDWDRKDLQLVLEIPLVKGSAGSAHLVAAHAW